MITETIISNFADNDIYCIPVAGFVSASECNGLIFDGKIGQFINAIKKLKIENVFLSKIIFSENEIFGEIEYELDDDDYEDSIKIIEIFPNAISYENKVGNPCQVRILAKAREIELNFYWHEEWYQEFVGEVLKALENFQNQENLKSAEINKKFEKKRNTVIKLLNELLSNQAFVKLPTQRAMIAYAEENIPDISILNESELKNEIQKLNDKLIARGKKP